MFDHLDHLDHFWFSSASRFSHCHCLFVAFYHMIICLGLHASVVLCLVQLFRDSSFIWKCHICALQMLVIFKFKYFIARINVDWSAGFALSSIIILSNQTELGIERLNVHRCFRVLLFWLLTIFVETWKNNLFLTICLSLLQSSLLWSCKVQ